jgi:PIN domain nuclease of toxin-antitoxin system
MRFLLDTHVLHVLIDQNTARFPPAIRKVLAEPTTSLSARVASLWELAIKSRLGKLHLAVPIQTLPELIRAMGIALITINEHHALLAVEPEPPTRDPFDRLLLAQCHVERLRLLTIDRALVAHAIAFGLNGERPTAGD